MVLCYSIFLTFWGFIYFIGTRGSTWVYLCTTCPYTGAHGGQQRASESLGLEWQALMSYCVDSVQEEQVLLPTEPSSLQPLHTFIFKDTTYLQWATILSSLVTSSCKGGGGGGGGAVGGGCSVLSVKWQNHWRKQEFSDKGRDNIGSNSRTLIDDTVGWWMDGMGNKGNSQVPLSKYNIT